MLARNLSLKIELAQKDVTEDISPFVQALTYEDNLSGEADLLTLELQDRKRLFIGDWFPPRGATFDVTLIKNNFNGNALIEELPLGQFEIDEVENNYSPSICHLKAVSIPQNSSLRQADESKSFENVKLSEIAAQIAKDSGVELFYKTEDDPLIQRAECQEQSRLSFLEKLCADNGLALKFADNTLIIFDEAELEQNEAVKTFERDLSPLKHFQARATIQDVYKKCVVSYRHGKHDELFEGEFDCGREQGKTLKINQKVDNQAEAERLAKKKLRAKNREEIRITLSTIGDFALLAGNCIELAGHGFYDGKYLIVRATHSADGAGYDTRLECRKCLEGY